MKSMMTVDPKTGMVTGQGTVAQKLLANNMNVNALRTNDTLKYLEWQLYDAAILKAAQLRLNGVGALLSRGLNFSLTNGLGRTVLVTQTASNISDADISMDGVTLGNKDRLEYGLGYLPLPIIHKDYTIDARTLNASRNLGEPMDTSMAELASRKVAERVEKMLFQGASSYTFGGGTIYGLQDFPNRNTGSMAHHWTATSATGATIVQDVINMKQAAISARHFGPYLLFVPVGYETVLDEDFKTYSNVTIRERIMAIEGIEQIIVSDWMTADNIILVQATPDVIRMVTGMAISNVEWATEGNMRFHFKVMTIMVPQIRSDYANRCGVVHYT